MNEGWWEKRRTRGWNDRETVRGREKKRKGEKEKEKSGMPRVACARIITFGPARWSMRGGGLIKFPRLISLFAPSDLVINTRAETSYNKMAFDRHAKLSNSRRADSLRADSVCDRCNTRSAHLPLDKSGRTSGTEVGWYEETSASS